MSGDHTRFLEDEHEILIDLPGFPFLRVDPLLFDGDRDEVSTLLDSPHEEVLFSLHGHKSSLLVLSNRRLLIYTIPKLKGIIRRAAGFAMSFVPLGSVGDVMDAVDAFKDVGTKVMSLKHWASPKERRMRKRRDSEGMPNRKDIKDVVWDLRKPEILAMINCYRERILVENSFGWKLETESTWADESESITEIRLNEDEVSFLIQKSEGEVSKPLVFQAVDTPFGFTEIMAYLADQNAETLASHGWAAECDASVTLRKV